MAKFRSGYYYYFDEYSDGPSTIQIHEEDKTPVATGLLNADGNMLFKQIETVPMGFHTNKSKN